VRRDSHCRNHSQGSRFLQYTGIPSHTRDSFGKRPGKEGLIRCWRLESRESKRRLFVASPRLGYRARLPYPE
jgi:hypothetical protein